MAQGKSLRLQIADIIGLTNSSPMARAIYMLVDKIEVLEKDNEMLLNQQHSLDDRTSGLKMYGGPKGRQRV